MTALSYREPVTVPARQAKAVTLRTGERLRITDLDGGQVGDVFAYNADDITEHHSASHTRTHTSRLFPALGESFVTNRRRPILTYLADTSPGVHDMLIAACDPERYAAYGDPDHASCADNLRHAMSDLGYPALPTIPQPINVFMRIPVTAGGTLSWLEAATAPGDSITLRAEMDCLVVVSSCPQDHNVINGTRPTPLALTILPPTTEEKTMITTELAHPALEPTAIGALTLRNRFAVAPMTRISAESDGTPTAQMSEYYHEFAAGGFGLIITEGTYTDATHSQGYYNQPGLVTQRHIAGWRNVVDAVHAAGAPIVAQLMHAGAISQGNAYGYNTIGPSSITPPGQMMPDYGGVGGPWNPPREMTARDIEDVVAGFSAAAENARAAGFDGVEIHAANGYLLDQFLTDYTNQRTDEYGGPVQNRIRLTVRVLRAIREALGDFPIGVRLSQTKVNDFTYRWPGAAADARAIFTALTDATYLHIASEGKDFLETARFPSGSTITELARKVSGRPVIANGGMHALPQAADVLTGGHADMLSLGRGALANPDLPRRVETGAALEPFDHAMLHPMACLDNAAAWRARRAG